MSLYIYGDVTIDDYEYFGNYSKAYKDLFDATDAAADYAPPNMSGHTEHRIVARALGGAYLLKRFASIALSLWRNKEPVEIDDNKCQFKGLENLTPWLEDGPELHKLNSEITKHPSQYDNVLRLYYRLKETKDKCYRVDPNGSTGYTFPVVYRKNSPHFRSLTNTDKLVVAADSKAYVLLFNDGGLRYPKDQDNWLDTEIAGLSSDNIWAVVKARDPAVKSDNLPFVRYLSRLKGKLPERTIVCLNADDLRASGVAIGRSLSWEKSIKELVKSIHDGVLLPDRVPAHLIVTFDYDGAVYLNIDNIGRPRIENGTLIFSQNDSEGEFSAALDGTMPGAQSLLVSVFSTLLHEWLMHAKQKAKPPIANLMAYSLLAKRRMLEAGFAPLNDKHIMSSESSDGEYWLIPKVFYQEAIFALPEVRTKDEDRTKGAPNAFLVSEKARPAFRDPLAGDKVAGALGVDVQGEKEKGSIKRKPADVDEQAEMDLSKQAAKDLSERKLAAFNFDFGFFDERINQDIFQHLAKNYVDREFTDYVVNYVIEDDRKIPICAMGRLKTISSKEIESLRTIRRLVNSYLENNRSTERPIGIAVFGPPGTGKSFAVKNVFETLANSSKELTEGSFLECNLSGLERPEDIAQFFQLARDRRLRGKVPILFFDEFDCSVEGEQYFWLKHFLAPLQDGEFISGHMRHPIGKSIFIFAGGTNFKYSDFETNVAPELTGEQKGTNDDSKHRATKGRDFLSRLQAHLDIMGLEPESEELRNLTDKQRDEVMKPYLMRKAILLRGLLEQWAPKIFAVSDGTKKAGIDRDVVHQFLCEWKYKHGVRSMEAIIRMSALHDGRHFSRYCLPPQAQLSMHVHSTK